MTDKTSLFDSLVDPASNSDSVEMYGPVAASFETGSDVVLLSEVELGLYDPTPSDGGSVTVTLVADNGNTPGVTLETLGTIADSSLATNTNGVVDLSGFTPIALAPNTQYWIEVTATSNSGAELTYSFPADNGTGVASQYFYEQGDSPAVNPNSDGPFLMNVTATTSPLETTLFNSLGDGDNNSDSIAAYGPLAASFSTGATPGALDYVELGIYDPTPSDGGTITVTLNSDTGSGPGSAIATLATVSDSSLSSTLTGRLDLSSLPQVSLAAGTRYWIEVTASAGSDAQFTFGSANGGTGVSGEYFYTAGAMTANSASTPYLMEVDEVPCYCRGTPIATPDGEVAVEDIAIGDLVTTQSGEAKPVKWIGRRSYEGRFIRRKRDVLPVCIAAGALGEGIPARDLWVSPGHSLYLDGLLVPALLLVNGLTITQAQAVDRVEYFHLEFEGHEIVFAAAAPAESYVESDNRRGFHNAHEFDELYPNDNRPSFRDCAPRLEPGMPELTTIRERLFARASERGHRLTADPDLHLVVDGVPVRPTAVEDCRYVFTLDAKPTDVFLASRTAIPAELELLSTDTRRLGASVERIVLRDRDLRLEVAHGHPALVDGFHADEGDRRWTSGLGRLPGAFFAPFTTGLTIEIDCLPALLRYALPEQTEPGAAHSDLPIHRRVSARA